MFKGLFIKKIGKRSTKEYLEHPLPKDEFIEIISSLKNINIENVDFINSFYLRYCSNLFPSIVSLPFESYSKYFWRTECLDIEPSSNKDQYWLDRGWSLEEIKKIKSSKYGTCSLDYYISKGYSKNEAENILKERTADITKKANKTKKEISEADPTFLKRGGYGINKWLLLGYSEEEATKKYEEIKSLRFEKIQEFHKENPNFYKGKRRGQIEYWTAKGFTEEEAREKVTESQRTFSLEKCIEKYGEEEGLLKFEERQRKWSKKIEEKYRNGEFSKIPKTQTSSRYSKLAKLLFDSLLNRFPGAKTYSDELELIFENKTRVYFDFSLGNKIIEFNGDYWHCNPKNYDPNYYHKRLKMKASEKWKIDEEKVQLAESHGYEVLVVWESEYKENLDHIINKCLNFLNE